MCVCVCVSVSVSVCVCVYVCACVCVCVFHYNHVSTSEHEKGKNTFGILRNRNMLIPTLKTIFLFSQSRWYGCAANCIHFP